MLIAVSALMVVSSLIIIPENAYGADETGGTTDTTLAEEAVVEETTDTTLPEEPAPAETTDTTLPEEPAPAETTDTTLPEEPAPAETTDTTLPEEPAPAVEETPTTTLVEEPVAEIMATGPADDPTPESVYGLFGAATFPTTVGNPNLDASCGINVALLVDSSGSIGSHGSEVYSAYKAVLKGLAGTGSYATVVDYSGGASLEHGWKVINNANDFDYSYSVGGMTNWTAAFGAIPGGRTPDLIIMFSDGNPNDGGGISGAIGPANGYKGAGAHILGVAIGSSIDLDNFRAITDGTGSILGPPPAITGSTIKSYDIIQSSFSNLEKAMNQVASALCDGHINVTKLVDGIPADGWTFSATDHADGTTGSNGTTTFSWRLIDPATKQVKITETAQSGYEFVSYTCGSVSGTTLETDWLTVEQGKTLNCAFSNTNKATLTLYKIVKNDNGGSASPTDWTLHATGPDQMSGVPTLTTDPLQGYVGPQEVTAGTYTLSETGGIPGYAASPWTCVIGGVSGTGTSITLGIGDNQICYIINDDIAPQLTLFKEVVNDNGGTMHADAWTLAANGAPGGFSAQATAISDKLASVGPRAVEAGVTYTLTESGPAGYGMGLGWSCSIDQETPFRGGLIKLSPGEVAECTIVNDDLPATIAIDKRTNGTDGLFIPVGDPVTWTYLVVNLGDVAITGVSVTDTDNGTVAGPPTGDTGGDGVLDPGEAWTYTVVGVARPDYYVNGATVIGTATTGAPVSASDGSWYFGSEPSIEILKTGQFAPGATGHAGDVILYRFRILNTGNVSLEDVSMHDAILDGAPLCDWAGSSVAWTGPGLLMPAEFVYCTGAYTTVQADFNAGRVDNTGHTTGIPPVGPNVTDSDAFTIALEQNPDISIVKTGVLDLGIDGIATPGDEITFDFTVTNTGNVTLTSSQMDDPGLAGITCDWANATLGSPPGQLVPTESVDCTGIYPITQTDIDHGSRFNTAAAEGKTPRGNDVHSDDSAWVFIPRVLGISLEKTGMPDSGFVGVPAAGDGITYTFAIENTGNTTLSGTWIDDLLLDDEMIDWSTSSDPITGDQLLSPGETVTGTGTYVLTQTDIDSGHIDNCATVTADSMFGMDLFVINTAIDSVSATACESLYLPQEPMIEILKTPETQDVIESETATFTIEVANTGNVTLSDVAVTDTLAPDCDSGIWTLDPGESMTYECTLDDVVADFTNIAEVTGTPPLIDNEIPQPPVTDSDEADVVVLHPEFVTKVGICLEEEVGGIQLDRPYLAWDSTNWPTGAVLNIRVFDKDMNLYSEGTVVNAAGSMFWPGYDDSGFDPVTGIGGIVYPPAELRPIYIQIYTNPATPVTLVEYPPATDGCTPNPAIDVDKAASLDTVVLGESVDITWTITVTNTGDSLLQNVELVDALAPACDLSIGNLDAGESVEQMCTVTYTAEDIGEALMNTAVATGIGLWGTEVSAEDSVGVKTRAAAPNGSIGDTVFNDVNENGVQDTGEKGIAGALVKLTLPDSTTLNTTTDADGKYLFSGLGVGEYTVEVVMSSIDKPTDGDLKLTTPGSLTIVLAAGEVDHECDFGVVATLPKTGINTLGIVMVALALLIAGAIAVLITTRRGKNEGDQKA